MSRPKVFISYSHDSPEHAEKVRGLGASLSRDGCDCRIDVYKESGEDWPAWMTRQLIEADFILCVVTETYERRFRDQELPDAGLGIGWEAGLIRRLLYRKKLHNDRIFPVLFAQSEQEHIPLELQGYDSYLLDSAEGYEALLRKVLGQPLHRPPASGTAPDLRSRQTAPRFARPDGTAPAVAATVTQADISRIDTYAPENLIGREDELAVLDAAWQQAVHGAPNRPRILTFVALGGEGKTSLVAKWAAKLSHANWPGCEIALAWSFYSQGARDHAAASSDTFFKEALTFFGDAEMANSAADARDKAKRLARLVGERRTLLILDGLEPLQYSPGTPTAGELKDHGLAALLKGLATTSNGLCVVTTRYSIPDLRAYRQTGAPERELLRLSTGAGVTLLEDLGVRTGSKKDFEELVEDVNGHALTLQIMGGYLKKAFGGDIRCQDCVTFEKADDKIQGGHAFRAMAAYETWMQQESDEARRELAVLRLMGLFDRPADAGCLEALIQPPAIPKLTEPLVEMAVEDFNFSLDALEGAGMITVLRDGAGSLLGLDAHPLLREYFADQLEKHHGDAFCGAHQRLFEHLCAATNEGEEPDLEDLQPLYQAVAHGCRAGLQQEACDKVYFGRILRGNEHYSWHNLGAYSSEIGAHACFFEIPWRRVSIVLPPADQAWLLNEAAFCLRALGRLTEALEPMRAGLVMRIQQKDWENAAMSAGNLCELELTLGDVTGAVKDAQQAVAYADRSGVAFQKLGKRTTHADALHQAGRRAKALALFQEAEQMQAEAQPDYPLLYSLQGFQYCDLLLAGAEREAGRIGAGGDKEALSAVCNQVSKRAVQSLKISNRNNWLLDIALDHLILGRAELFGAILQQADFRNPGPDLAHIDRAVDGLRCAGQQQYLPPGLLTRAWLRSLTGHFTGPESAQSDLDEAWEIARRGPMPLHMADIHLFRARLFFRQDDYPWESPHADLKEARRLIEKHGYWRRKEELEDAEAAILPGKPGGKKTS